MADEHEGKQFQGQRLESFRDNKSGSIRVLGADFSVVIAESGEISIHYPERIVRVAPNGDVTTELKLVNADVRSPRSKPARRRGSR